MAQRRQALTPSSLPLGRCALIPCALALRFSLRAPALRPSSLRPSSVCAQLAPLTMADDSPKRRKANFNEAETEALIALVLRHERLLFAGGPGRASSGQRRRLWEQIRRRVNALAACPREVEDLKKRWRDLKRRDRGKLRRLSSEGGPPGEQSLLGGNSSQEPPSPHPRFTEEPGPSSQPCFAEMKLKEEIVVKIVEPDEESSEETAVAPPSQEHFPLMDTPYFSSFENVNARTDNQPQADESDNSEQDLIHLQQQQIRVMQFGFDSVNHNLRLLQHSMQDLSSGVNLMAHTLEAIKNVYVKNNAGPVNYASSSTQTASGYQSPGSPAAEDRSRTQVTESSSRSSSCSSSCTSQEHGPDFPRLQLKDIKKEQHTNGCYYSLADT